MTTLDLLRGAGGPARGGDGAAVLTSSAAPVQLDPGSLALLLLAVVVVASVIGGIAAIAWGRVHDPRNHTETDGP